MQPIDEMRRAISLTLLWIGLALLLGLFGFAAHQLRLGQTQEMQAVKDAAQRELDLLARVLQGHLQQGQYHQAHQMLQNWGGQQAHIAHLALKIAQKDLVAEYHRGQPTRGPTWTLQTTLSFGEEKAELVMAHDLSPVEQRQQRQRLILAVAFGVMSLLLFLWVRQLQLRKSLVAEQQRLCAHALAVDAQLKTTQAERDRLFAILEATPDLVGRMDPEGRLLYLNKAGRKLTGLEQTSLAEHRIQEIHPAWAIDIIREQGIPAAIRDGIWSGETAVLDAHGAEIPVSQVIIAHHDDQGQLQCLSTIMRDISGSKAVKAALRASEAQLAEAQAIAHLGSWDMDLASGQATWSDEEYRLLGYVPGEVHASAEAFLAHVPEEDRAAVWSEIQASMQREGGAFRIEHRVVCPRTGSSASSCSKDGLFSTPSSVPRTSSVQPWM